MKTRQAPAKSRKIDVKERVVRRPSGIGLAIPCVVIVAAMAAVFAARIRLLDVPLERDEGEYGYLGQLILQGVAPYGVAANMKLPGTYLIYALVMAIFGQTRVAIHLGLLLADAVNAVLVYCIARKFFRADLFRGRVSSAALAAAGAFTVLAAGQGVMGLWAHATHFVLIFALAGTLLILKWGDARNPGLLFASGVCFGLAFVMKQPGILFAPMGAVWILRTYWRDEKRARHILGGLALFSAGVMLPFGGVCLWLWRAGVFDRFWFWIVTYGREYGSMVTIPLGFQAFWLRAPGVVKDGWPLWLLAAIGAILQVRGLKKGEAAMCLLAFAALSLAAVCPGLYFREHYFVLLLPAVALLAGAATADFPATKGILGPTARLWIIAAATVLPLLSQERLLFELSPVEASKSVYASGPFVEAIEAAKYIENHTAKDAKIAILGSEPEIFFYAHRRSATPYIYVYSMMEPQPYAARMQDEYIRDIETAAPEYIVLVNNEGSWVLQQGSTERIMEWWPGYGNAHYEQVGLADMTADGTKYYWDSEATHTAPRGHLFLAALKRKGR